MCRFQGNYAAQAWDLIVNSTILLTCAEAYPWHGKAYSTQPSAGDLSFT
jgi:hypothetical protein